MSTTTTQAGPSENGKCCSSMLCAWENGRVKLQSVIYFKCAQSQCALSLCMPCAAGCEQFCLIIIITLIIIILTIVIIIIITIITITIMYRCASQC